MKLKSHLPVKYFGHKTIGRQMFTYNLEATRDFSGTAVPSGAGDANYSELFWDVWDMIDRLYFAYNLSEKEI